MSQDISGETTWTPREDDLPPIGTYPVCATCNWPWMLRYLPVAGWVWSPDCTHKNAARCKIIRTAPGGLPDVAK